MSDPKDVVEELLSSGGKRRGSRVLDGRPELVAALVHFLDLKAAGDARASVTLCWFYREHLQARYDGPAWDAVRRYLRDVQKRCVTTGGTL